MKVSFADNQENEEALLEAVSRLAGTWARAGLLAISLVASGLVGCLPVSHPSSAATRSNEPPAGARVDEDEPMRSDDSIGTARMESDGTIVLQLRAEGPGMLGDAQLRYPRGHKEYDQVLEHLGGLRPGETKSVPPWPDDPR